MKILYIGAFRLPNYDAAAPRVLNNAKAFREAGHEVSFISWGGKYRETDLCEDGKYRVDGFEYVITGELDGEGSLLKRAIDKMHRGEKSLAVIQKMIEQPDLIVMYNADRNWTKTMIRYCQEHNIKLANDMTEWYDNNELRPTDILPNYLNMTRTQHEVQNKVVISSRLEKYYKNSNNLLLPPLCDKAEDKWGKEVEDDRIKPFDGVTLIYAGNPAKKDCVHTVINAVNELANGGAKIRFMILGTTRESYIERYKSLLKNSNLHENIMFLGRVSQDLIPAYYKKADFMVLLRKTSRKNMMGFPTKFAESMTAGVPVIANATSDLDKYIVNGRTGFLLDSCSYEDILFCLKNRVLLLDRSNIESMKLMTCNANSPFDYRSHKNAVEEFFKKLK